MTIGLTWEINHSLGVNEINHLHYKTSCSWILFGKTWNDSFAFMQETVFPRTTFLQKRLSPWIFAITSATPRKFSASWHSPCASRTALSIWHVSASNLVLQGKEWKRLTDVRRWNLILLVIQKRGGPSKWPQFTWRCLWYCWSFLCCDCQEASHPESGKKTLSV